MPEGLSYPLDARRDARRTTPPPGRSGGRKPAGLPESFVAAIARGALNRCPACAGSPLFSGFLKPFQACPTCGQDWTHQRADDFPAYLVILLTGHLLAPAIIAVEMTLSPPLWLDMILWPSCALALMLLLLQPAKGAVIAAQWRLGMHGFSKAPSGHDEAGPAGDA